MGAACVCGRGVEAGDGGMKRVFDIFLGCLAALVLFVLVLLVAMVRLGHALLVKLSKAWVLPA